MTPGRVATSPPPAHERLGEWDEDGMVFRASARPTPRHALLVEWRRDLTAMCVLDEMPVTFVPAAEAHRPSPAGTRPATLAVCVE